MTPRSRADLEVAGQVVLKAFVHQGDMTGATIPSRVTADTDHRQPSRLTDGWVLTIAVGATPAASPEAGFGGVSRSE